MSAHFAWKERVLRDRLGLPLYLLAVLAATLVHDPRILGLGLLLTVLAAGRDLPRVLRRAVLSVLFFTGAVSLSYLVAGLLRGSFSWTYLLRLNLRVLLLACLSFLLPRRVDLIRALDFSPFLLRLTLLTYGQIITFRRIFHDFSLALRSRSLVRPRLTDHYRQRAATAGFFLEKSLRDAQEITQAMSSRGFFLDQD